MREREEEEQVDFFFAQHFSFLDLIPFSLWRRALASATDVRFPPRGACNWLELDPTEQRYLLAASGDGSVSAFDVGGGGGGGSAAEATTNTTAAAPAVAVPPLFVLGGRAPASNNNSSTTTTATVAHRFAATCVTWYPVDSGAFVSGGADGEVKVWDANAEAAVAAFSLASGGGVAASAAAARSSSATSANDSSGLPRVMCVAMSPAAGSSHALIAVGAAAGGGAGAISAAPPGGSALRLADARAGALTHSLGGGGGGGSNSNSHPNVSGSAAAVWCAAWSLSDPHQRLSGHADGAARAWDVRRADACVASLDLDDTRDARREERQRRRQQMQQRQRSQRQRAEEAEEAGEEEGGGGNGTTTTAQLPPPPPPRTSASFRRAHDAAVTGLLPTPDGLSWVTAGADSAVRLWSASPSSSTSASGSSEGAFQNELHSLPETFNRARRPRQLAAARDPAALFHPSGSGVQVLPLPGGERAGYFRIGGGGDGGGGDGGGGGRHRGNLSSADPSLSLSGRRKGVLLRGHVDAVHACAWCESRRELYTGGDDKAVLVWSSAAAAAAAAAEDEEEEEDEEREENERRVRRRRGAGGDDEDAWSD